MSDEEDTNEVLAQGQDETPAIIYIDVGGEEYKRDDYSVASERTFREAWEVVENAISVDMVKAKDVWRDKIRIKRAKLFSDLDANFMKALETGEDTSSIVAQKQALRDAPANSGIDAATTPEELKAVQPLDGVTIE